MLKQFKQKSKLTLTQQQVLTLVKDNQLLEKKKNYFAKKSGLAEDLSTAIHYCKLVTNHTLKHHINTFKIAVLLKKCSPEEARKATGKARRKCEDIEEKAIKFLKSNFKERALLETDSEDSDNSTNSSPSTSPRNI